MDACRARKPEIRDEMFDSTKAPVHFGGIVNFKHWQMYMHIKETKVAIYAEDPAVVASQADTLRQMFSWIDAVTDEICLPSISSAKHAIFLAGKPHPRGDKLDKLAGAYKSTDCGTMVPHTDPESDEAKKLESDRRSRAKKHNKFNECQAIVKSSGKKCLRKTAGTFCGVHIKKAREDSSTAGDGGLDNSEDKGDLGTLE